MMNYKNEAQVSVSLNLICKISLIMGFCILAFGFYLKFIEEVANKILKYISEGCIIVGPTMISLVGISVVIEYTSYRKTTSEIMDAGIKKIYSGEAQDKYILNNYKSDKIFDLFYRKSISELSENNIYKNGFYIDESKRIIFI